MAAFQLAYTLFQPLCGWLIDVIGLKTGFMICATLWALVCMLHAGAGSWVQLALLRFSWAALKRPPRPPTPVPSPTGFRRKSGPSPQAGPG